MNSKRFVLFVLVLACLSGGSGASARAASMPARRIHDNLENGRTFLLKGNTSALASSQNDAGEVEDSFEISNITIHFQMSAAQQADLENLLAKQQDQSSGDYHKWLTPEQYAQRFGMNPKDLEKVSEWLQSNGFTDVEIARSRTWISFSGTALQIRNAFSTSIHQYNMNGEKRYANTADPVLPRALEGIVEGIRGLHNFRPRPRIVTRTAKTDGLPRFTSSVSGSHFIAPDDFATIYNLRALYNGGIDGTGQKIAIAGQTDIELTDIRAFRKAAGLPANDPEIVLNGKDPGTSKDDQSEAYLDIEWSGAVARQATIIYVNSSNAFDSAVYAVDNNLAPVLSISYGNCETNIGAAGANSLSSTFKQANAQGMTVLAASGDAGAADCDGPLNPSAPVVTSASRGLAVDMPGSSPYVTSVGGTEFSDTGGNYWSATNNSANGSALSYIPEIAWNDTSTANGLAASGGGKSVVFTKPAWQKGESVPNDGARDTPDVSLAASANYEGYLVCSGGNCTNGFRSADMSLMLAGGTSVTAPTFAGIVALLDQQTKTSQGNVNPRLYLLASFSSDIFHDITQGNNRVPCKAATTDCTSGGTLGYSAGPGYDQVTGLGSIDGNNLINQWSSDFQMAITPASLTVGPSRSNTATVEITSVGNFAGTVSFTCSVPSALVNVTCSIPGTVSHSGTATLTISNSSLSNSFRLPPFGYPGNRGAPWIPIAVACSLLMGVCLATFPKRRNRTALVGLTIGLMAIAASCGEGDGSTSSNETPTVSVTAPVTVTATSGVESHTATVSVTAQ
jgi:subtilase family serine protease